MPKSNHYSIAAIFFIISSVAGCSFSGLGTSSSLSCSDSDKSPSSKCEPISVVYSRSIPLPAPKSVPVPILTSLPKSVKANVQLQAQAAPETHNTLVSSAPAIENKKSAPRAIDIPNHLKDNQKGNNASELNTVVSAEQMVPLRRPPRIIRILVTPFIDTDGDLNDSKYIYAQIDDGAWVIEALKVRPNVTQHSVVRAAK